MAKDFRHYCQQSHPKSGEVWFWGGADKDGGSARIINLLTQEPSESASGIPGKASLHNVNHVLKSLAGLIAREKLNSIALPRLATGVGGLEWNDVRPLIETHLGALDATVIIYATYLKGVRANEAGAGQA